MSQQMRYPGRQFLGQCAAIPLAAGAGGIVLSAEPMRAVGDETSASILAVPRMPESELAVEVQSLLKLVDPRVLHRRESIADASNAWPLWEQAGKVLTPQPDDEEFQEGLDPLLDGKPISPDLRKRITDWASTNEQSRELTDQGIARGRLELPRAGKTIRLSLAMDEITLIRSLTRLKGITARLRLDKQDVAGARDEAFSILKIGTMLLRSECLIVDYLVGQAILGYGVFQAYQTATSLLASEEQALAVIGRLATAKSSTDDLKRAYRAEVCRWFLPYVASFPKQADHSLLARYYIAADIDADYKPTDQQLRDYARSIRQTAFLIDGHPRPLDKPSTIRLLSDMHVKLFERLDKPAYEIDDDLFAALNNELSDWPAEAGPDWWLAVGLENPDPPQKLTEKDLQQAREALRRVDNVLGKYLVAQLMSAVNLGTQQVNHARIESARIRIALRLFEKRHRKLPSRLEDLQADGLLSEVPIDPYDGNAFKYSADQRLLWCVSDKDESEVEPKEEDVRLRWRIAG